MEPISSESIEGADNNEQNGPMGGHLVVVETTDKSYRIYKTIFMMTIWIYVGLSMSIIPPSVDDLRRQVNCNYQQLTYALIGRSIGTVLGAVSLGLVNEKHKGHTDICIGAELLVGGVALAALPWLHHLVDFSVCLTCVGFACGGLSASGNSHVVHMWGEKASTPIHLVHFGFGLGTVVGPLMIGPFLSKNITNSSSTTSSLDLLLPQTVLTISSAYSQCNTSGHRHKSSDICVPNDSHNLTESRINIPYGLSGGLAVASALGFFALYFLSVNKALYLGGTVPLRQHNKFIEILNPGSCAGGNTLYGVEMFGLLLLLYILIVSKDTLVNTFLYAIAVDTSLAFTAWHGVLITTTYWVAYALSRLVFAFIGHFVRIQVIIFFEMALVLISQVALVVWGLKSQLAFWLTTAVFGFTAGPVYPSGMAFVNRYLTMTPVAFSVLDIGIGTGALVSNWVTGYIFQHKTAQDLFYVSLGCGVSITIVLVVMQMLGHFQGDRYVRARQAVSSTNENIQDVEPLIN